MRCWAAEDGRELPPADAVVVLMGFRPDLSFLAEMRLDLDPVLQAPRRIAPDIDPNVHFRGTATPTLAADLAHPEPDLYLAGMKSYGRAPNTDGIVVGGCCAPAPQVLQIGLTPASA